MSEIDLFRTRDYVPDFDEYVRIYRDRSARSRSQLHSRLDVVYGEGTLATLDLFSPGEEVAHAPIHLFIHGGYWRMFDKSDFSFVADTVTASDGIAAIMNYDLMPAVRMEKIVQQVRAAAKWLGENATSFGGDPERLTISGHSAGAHLCSFLLDGESPIRPKGALMLSGIYDLGPLQHSFLEREIGITDQEVARFSPLLLNYRETCSVQLMAGENETEPFHDQARAFAEVLAASKGANVSFQPVPGAHHMNIVLDLGDPGTLAGQALSGLVRA